MIPTEIFPTRGQITLPIALKKNTIIILNRIPWALFNNGLVPAVNAGMAVWPLGKQRASIWASCSERTPEQLFPMKCALGLGGQEVEATMGTRKLNYIRFN